MEKSSGGSERLPLLHVDVSPQYYEHSGMEGAQGGEGRGAGPEGQDSGQLFRWKKSDFFIYFGIFTRIEHVGSSRVYSEVHLAAERDTTWGLGVRAMGEGSREGVGRGHRQR